MKFIIIIPMFLLAASCIKPTDTSPRIAPADVDADYCLDFRGDEPTVRLVKKYRNFEPALLNIPKKPYFDCGFIYITTATYFYFFGETEEDRLDEHWWVFGANSTFVDIIDGGDDGFISFRVKTRQEISPMVQIDFLKSQFISLKKERKKEDLLQFKNKIIDAEIHKYFVCKPDVDTSFIIKFRARITGECEQKKNSWQQPPWNIGAASEDSVFAEPSPDGTLVIRGNGRVMDFDFENNNRPWLEMCDEETTKIVVDSGVTHIGDFAFRNCRGVSSATIGSSVAFIYKGAFEDCEKLSSITVLNPTPPSLYNNDYWSRQEISTAFEGVNKDTCTIYVPKGSLDAYRNAYGWEDFENIKPIE